MKKIFSYKEIQQGESIQYNKPAPNGEWTQQLNTEVAPSQMITESTEGSTASLSIESI